MIVVMKGRFVFPDSLMLHHMLLFLDYIFLLFATFIAIMINGFDEAIFSEDVMDWCMRLLQDLSVF